MSPFRFKPHKLTPEDNRKVQRLQAQLAGDEDATETALQELIYLRGRVVELEAVAKVAFRLVLQDRNGEAATELMKTVHQKD